MDSQVSKRLNTWIPIDVFEGLTSFAKEYAGTGLGKWDYAVAIRILLIKSQLCDQIFELDKRLRELESKEGVKVESIMPEGYYQVKTLGDLKLNKTKEVQI